MIDEHLSYFVESAIFSTLYIDRVWDGFHRYYDKHFTMDFGLGIFLYKKLKKKTEVVLKDYDKYKNKIQVESEELNENLHEHQREAVLAFFKNDFGILQIPTRGGKTFTSAECIRIFLDRNKKGKCLFIVDGDDLFSQTKEELAFYFKIKESDIGEIKGQSLILDKPITVATIQTLVSIVKLSKEKMKEKKNRTKRSLILRFLDSIGFLVIDEIHEIAADKRVFIIKKCQNIQFLLGLSATPYKSENRDAAMTVRGYSGGVVYKISYDELVRRGVLVEDEVWLILFKDEAVELIYKSSAYENEMENKILKSQARNNLILNIANFLNENNIKTLILTTRTAHGELLSEQSGYPFLSGKDNKNIRKEARKYFLGSEGGVLIASDIFKKGVSLNSCKTLLNVSVGKEQSSVVQKRGRVIASSPGKTKALIFDFIDESEYFLEHSMSRIDGYNSVLPEHRIKFYDSSEEGFLTKILLDIKEYFNV